VSIADALKQQQELAEMLEKVVYIDDDPNPSKVAIVAAKLRQRPQLLFDLLAEFQTDSIASTWDEETTTVRNRPGTTVWRRRNPRGDNVAHIVHAHPDSDEGDTWHAILSGSGHVKKGIQNPQEARIFADAFLEEKGYTLIGGAEKMYTGPWIEEVSHADIWAPAISPAVFRRRTLTGITVALIHHGPEAEGLTWRCVLGTTTHMHLPDPAHARRFADGMLEDAGYILTGGPEIRPSA
jgi:hypothetical protein